MHDQTAVIVDTMDEEATFNAIKALCGDRLRIASLQRAGLRKAALYSVHGAALSECLALEPALQTHRTKYPKLQRSRLLVCASRDTHGELLATGYQRLIVPYKSAGVRQAFQIQHISELPPAKGCEILLLQNSGPEIEIARLRQWLHEWKSVGGRLVYDIDEDLPDTESLQPIHRYNAREVNDLVERVRLLATQADLILTSTSSLAKKFRGFNSNVVLQPNTLDREMWGLHLSRHHNEGEFARRPDVVRIGYIGTPAYEVEIDLITPVMEQLKADFGSRIEIEVIGGFEKSVPTFGKRVGLPRRKDYPSFVRWLQARLHWDIVVIPAGESDIDASKSYVQFLESAALDMAIVASEGPIFLDVARHGENCLLAKASSEDWVTQIATLITNEGLRTRLAQRARQDLIDEHTTDHISHKIVENLMKLFAS